MSLTRQNYHELSEAGVNAEINRAQHLSYVYLSKSFYYDRDDVALPGMHKFFMDLSNEKHELAFALIKYQNERGGKVLLQQIDKPQATEFAGLKDSLALAIQNEKKTNEAFLTLCEQAEKRDDPHLADFVEEELLEPIVKNIKKLADLHANASRVGAGLGEYIFDHELH